VPLGKIGFEKTLTHYDLPIILQNHVFFNIFDKKSGGPTKTFFGLSLTVVITIL